MSTPPTEPNKRFYLDELVVGQRFVSGRRVIERERIIEFGREFDPQPFHLDDELARDSIFGGLAASGWHTASLTMRLLVEGGCPIAGGLIGRAISLEWPMPTRPGDTLQVECEVVDIAPSRSRPDRGIVTLTGETRNQAGDIVQRMTVKLNAPIRPR